MNSNDFTNLLEEKKTIITDGATGTNLIQRGLKSGQTAENWVIEYPEKIMTLHKDFISAGAEIILTATFGASEINLAHLGMAEKYKEINQEAVRIAKESCKNAPALVAGSIGPLGQMLKPLGTLEFKDAKNYYSQQAESLCSGGADIIVIETQFDLNEAKAAIEGVRASCEQAVVCSFSFDRGTKTMMGVSPSAFAKEMKGYDLSAIGINCGKSLDENTRALKELFNVTDTPIWFKPNAGLPQIDAFGNPIYNTSPSQMAEYVDLWIESGSRIIGGCCGTSPAHLKSIADAINTNRSTS